MDKNIFMLTKDNQKRFNGRAFNVLHFCDKPNSVQNFRQINDSKFWTIKSSLEHPDVLDVVCRHNDAGCIHFHSNFTQDFFLFGGNFDFVIISEFFIFSSEPRGRF